MLRSLYIILIYLCFIILGAAAPFVFSLGYIWVDTFTPQKIAYIILPQIPVSLIMAALAIGSYFLFDRRDPPGISVTLLLTLALAAWVTITTIFFAVSPNSAWVKWDWAVKTILFSAFIPFVFRSRIQIEAFLQVYLFSLSVHFLPTGLKTIINGGGYGMALGVVQGNSGFAEGSTLAAVALMMLPIILYLRQHNLLLPKFPLTNLLYIGLAITTVTCAVGTYARTGLIGMVVVGVGLWLRSRHKVVFGCVGAMAVIALTVLTSDAWNQRISTISEYQSEESALGRILVWKWTLGFVADHPMGGGFNSYQVNEIGFPGPDGSSGEEVVRGKAFHSIYFEMLGEQGWPGLLLFLGLIATSFISLQRTSLWARKIPGMEWCHELAYALQISLIILLACGAFIGIAFQPMIYYIFALSACLAHQAKRARSNAAIVSQPTSWRSRRTNKAQETDPYNHSAEKIPASGLASGWRARAAVRAAELSRVNTSAHNVGVVNRAGGWRQRKAPS